MSPTVLTTRRERGVQGRHVLAGVLAFFALVFLVNGAMIYSAISTHTGLVAREPYRKGLYYNERISADERQARLGWKDAVELTRDGRIVVALTDGDDRPVPGRKVAVLIGRPSTDRKDVKATLSETRSGRYAGKTAPLEAGTWLVALEVRDDAWAEEPLYRARRRLWLKQ
jgi:nitrogen fixation protein FixH